MQPLVYLAIETGKRVDVSESELVEENTWRLRFESSLALRCLLLVKKLDGAYELTILQCYGFINWDIYLDDALAVKDVGGVEQRKKGMTFRVPPLPPIPPAPSPPPLIGTIEANGGEQTVYEVSSPSITLLAYIDLSRMEAGDEVVVREYLMIREGGEYVKYHDETYRGVQDPQLLYITPKTVTYGGKITIQQTVGVTFKSFDYNIIKEN